MFRNYVDAAADPAGQGAPPNDFVLPSLDQIWPLVMQGRNQLVVEAAGIMPHGSPQAQADWALGLAIIVSCTPVIQNEFTTPIGQQANILVNYTLNNGANIGKVAPYPPVTSEEALEQWIVVQMPDFTPAQLFPQGQNGAADYLVWGMACREMLVANGWDVSGITASDKMPTLHVSGRFLYDRLGNKVILRGVDLPLLDDWNFPGSDYLSEVAQTGANAIRIQWYITYPGRPAYATTDLGDFIDRCVAANIVPIVMLADDTCNGDPTLINSQIVPWWTSAEQTSVLVPRAACLILNLANELGSYRWADDPATALTAYADTYKTAIASMRAAGYTMPLMIDAPDCGTTLDAFTSIGAELVAADLTGNILLSTHAYWAGYDGRPFVPTAVANHLPIVFAEIANKQDEVVDGQTVYGYYDLDGTKENHPPSTGFTYQGFLETLRADEIGWLAWSWCPDSCDARRMSSDGRFASLTVYGRDIVNNATYGLKATAVRVSP